MPLQEGKRKSPLSRSLACVVLTRLLEAAWGGVVLSAGLLLENWIEPSIVDKWRYWTFCDLAETIGIVIVSYYVGFGYLITNAVALCFARYKRYDLTARRYAAVNVAVFGAHSTLIIILVVHASLTLPFWFAWAAMILFNLLAPQLLWPQLYTLEKE